MIRFLIRRVLGAVPLLIGIATIIFFAVHAAPGDPIDNLAPQGMTAEAKAQARARLGLDDPLPIQYVRWLADVARGDFGVSIREGRPALDVLRGFLPNTLILSGAALLVAFVLGILIGTIQAVRQNSVLDSALSLITLFFYSMPSFWLALIMILVFVLFASSAGWPIHFPASGVQSLDYYRMSGGARLLDRLWYLVLPATTLALVLMAGVARYMRSSMLEVVRQDYVRTARAKGLPESRVIFRHALRNALIPIVTLMGLYVPLLLTGTVFVEQVFQRPGVGLMIVNGIAQRDYPIIMVGSFFFAFAVVLGNLIADVLYGVVDPRIRYE